MCVSSLGAEEMVSLLYHPSGGDGGHLISLVSSSTRTIDYTADNSCGDKSAVAKQSHCRKCLVQTPADM